MQEISVVGSVLYYQKNDKKLSNYSKNIDEDKIKSKNHYFGLIYL